MKRMQVVSGKYDGSLRDEYETCLHEETSETLILFSPPGFAYYDHRKGVWLEAPDGLLEIYFKRRWYNIRHIAEPVSSLNLSYINIATPATLQDGVLYWTDLDLDYRVHLDGTIERLDEAEFEENVKRLGYPLELLEQVHQACQEVEAGLLHRTFPFDYEGQIALYERIKAERACDARADKRG